MPRRAYWQSVLDRIENALGWEYSRRTIRTETWVLSILDEIKRLRTIATDAARAEVTDATEG